jgi:hypothetical protein
MIIWKNASFDAAVKNDEGIFFLSTSGKRTKVLDTRGALEVYAPRPDFPEIRSMKGRFAYGGFGALFADEDDEWRLTLGHFGVTLELHIGGKNGIY